MPNNNLSADLYLVAKKKRGYSVMSVRRTTRPPALAADEVAVKLMLSLPEALFMRPQIQAKVVVPADAVTPPVLDVAVVDNVREVLERETGLSITLAVVNPVEEM